MDELKFDDNGLIPAIVQDVRSKQVLMVAYMNREAVQKTLRTGKTHFYSRSRKRMWLKGESSGHIQKVKSIALDCDGDALVVKVTQTGGACHTGYATCFYRRLEMQPKMSSSRKRGSDSRLRGNDAGALKWKVTGKRLFDPDKVYGAS